MGKYLYFIAPFIFTASVVAGQNDPAAVKILDRFSEKSVAAPSVSMKFELVTVNQMDNSNESIKGSIILSKNKYRLELPDNITWFNGETVWSYLIAEKEVTINKADKRDNSFQNRPSTIFSMYKEGYKCRLIEDKPDLVTIDLYPEDIKSEHLRVRLIIGKALLDLKSLEYKKRDGIVITLNVLSYDLNQKPEPNSFIYPQSVYKGAEVIDMR